MSAISIIIIKCYHNYLNTTTIITLFKHYHHFYELWFFCFLHFIIDKFMSGIHISDHYFLSKHTLNKSTLNLK